MFKTKSLVYKAILVLSLICILGGIVLSIQAITDENACTGLQVGSLFALGALVFAAYYVFAGYTKDAAGFYKVYTGIFGLSLLVALIDAIVEGTHALGISCTAIALAIIVVLLFVKNLGKTVSLTLCVVLLAACAFVLVNFIGANDGSPIGILNMLHSIVLMILAFMQFVITFAKYIDKKERGTN
ncbi:MAG: hypothetical protein KBS79_02135 [Lachnospiraceae bacterium]|nr:hypothetical protein [Candidatus Minthocola equi]